MGGAQPLKATMTMQLFFRIDIDETRIQNAWESCYIDIMTHFNDEAIKLSLQKKKAAILIGYLVGDAMMF